MRARGARERRIAGDGVELAVWEDGDERAPTVVLVHGYPDTHSVWSGVAARLAQRYHVVSYDVRGSGASTRPAAERDYRLERLEADLLAVIEATSPNRPVHLVGHDWGAIQGWEAVTGSRLTGRIASFTAIAGPCLDHVGARLRERASLRPAALADLARQLMRSWYILAFQIPRLGERVWRSGLDRRWPELLRRIEGVSLENGETSPTLAEDAVAGIALYRANLLARLLHPRERRTDVPVQVIAADGDHYVDPSLFDGIERWVPNLWRRRVHGGHWLVRQHPERVERWIAELIEHTGGSPASPGPGRRRRVVVVTGAGSGIGRQTALAFAECGAVVVAADIDDASAQRTAELCRLFGVDAQAARVDVGDAAAMESFADTIERDYGAPDVVVNNAGVGVAGPLLATPVAEWERTLRVNLWGVIHGSRLFGAQMVRRGEGGHIVNVASAAAFVPSRTLPAYATSKAAVLMLTGCLRAELSSEGIGVSAICPGIVDTPIATSSHHVGVAEGEQQRLQEKAALLYRRRGFTPDKVAAAVVRAVERNLAVVPVASEAYALRFLGLVPALARQLARIDLTPR